MAKTKDIFPKDYEKRHQLGKGGNGIVFSAINRRTREECAVKILNDRARNSKKRVERFTREIQIVTNFQSQIPGILPILEYSVSDLWFSMPIADEIEKYISEQRLSPKEIVKGISDIAETLTLLHQCDISHRDIKPENIFFYRGRFQLSDFGLGKNIKEENNITRSDKGLGAIFTIAPEMRRYPYLYDGKAADVYSLAKTLWILLTDNTKGFDGEYDFRSQELSLHSAVKLKGIPISLLDDLLIRSTKTDPQARPQMKEFKESLDEWLLSLADWNLEQKAEWNFLRRYLFGEGTDVPKIAIWKDIESIINVLNTITLVNANNHMLFPSGGGLDYVHAMPAHEDGCIYIETDAHIFHLVKPKALYFETFGSEDEWNYFYLETGGLSPILDENEKIREDLVEDYPNHYVSSQYEQYGVYDYEFGQPLPDGYKRVFRYLQGAFLIVVKDGAYNGIDGSYNAWHNEMDFQAFSNFISSLILLYHNIEQRGYERRHILNIIDRIISKNRANTILDRDINNVNYEEEDKMHDIDEEENTENTILDNWSEIDMSSSLNEISCSVGKLAEYWISYTPVQTSINDIVERKCYALCKDGVVRKIFIDDIRNNALFLGSIAEANRTIDICKMKVQEYCKQKGIKGSDCIDGFDVNIHRTGCPEHLFSIDDVSELIRNADDRNYNTLVINREGFAEIIQGRIDHLLDVFPVRLETWCPGNNYVGKYTNMYHLQSTYIMALEGWLKYLQRGHSIFVEFTEHPENEESILSLIKAIEIEMKTATQEN